MNDTHKLIAALRTPCVTQGFDLPQWDALIRIARRANVLARLAHTLSTQEWDALPPGPRAHLHAARTVSQRQDIAVRWEIDQLQHTLAKVGLPLVLLKGAAYVAAGNHTGAGRLFSDIDLLVPKDALDAAESALMQHGWQALPLTAYDQRYYRQWMHELPPMQHRTRGTALDVHHAILPPTARGSPPALPFLQASVAVGQGVFVLSPEDRVLHAACHWFYESEHQNGLRDVLDVVSLLEEFGADPLFGSRLVARAQALSLTTPLATAVAVGRQHLGLSLPLDLPAQPAWRVRLLGSTLTPAHPLTQRTPHRVARSALYLRGHWLRMPLPRLAAHLIRKGLTSGRQAAPD